MTIASHLFQTLAFDVKSQLWNDYELPKLTMVELRTLAMLFGCPKSGNKEWLVSRLLAVRIVRMELAKFGSDYAAVEALAAELRKERLKWMAEQAGTWRSGNKLQLATCLMNWRNRCRVEGQKIMDELLAARAENPKQMKLI